MFEKSHLRILAADWQPQPDSGPKCFPTNPPSISCNFARHQLTIESFQRLHIFSNSISHSAQTIRGSNQRCCPPPFIFTLGRARAIFYQQASSESSVIPITVITIAIMTCGALLGHHDHHDHHRHLWGAPWAPRRRREQRSDQCRPSAAAPQRTPV